MQIVAVISSLILTLLAVVVGMAKVQRLPASLQMRDQARISPRLWTVSGWIELLAAAGLVLGIFVRPELAVVCAAILLLSYLALAASQLAKHLPFSTSVPALALAALSVISVASIVAAG